MCTWTRANSLKGRFLLKCAKYSYIKKTCTSPYHPECDRLVERFNKTLFKMLRTPIDDNQSNCDDMLPYVLMAYRSVENKTTLINVGKRGWNTSKICI